MSIEFVPVGWTIQCPPPLTSDLDQKIESVNQQSRT
jgi:hypothetical protein